MSRPPFTSFLIRLSAHEPTSFHIRKQVRVPTGDFLENSFRLFTIGQDLVMLGKASTKIMNGGGLGLGLKLRLIALPPLAAFAARVAPS